jgi:protein CrcB
MDGRVTPSAGDAAPTPVEPDAPPILHQQGSPDGEFIAAGDISGSLDPPAHAQQDVPASRPQITDSESHIHHLAIDSAVTEAAATLPLEDIIDAVVPVISQPQQRLGRIACFFSSPPVITRLRASTLFQGSFMSSVAVACVLVAIGGAAGSVLRYGIALVVPPVTCTVSNPSCSLSGSNTGPSSDIHNSSTDQNGTDVKLDRTTVFVDYPFNTFIVNCVGSLLLGFLTRASIRWKWSMETLACLGSGFCGGLTTLSTLMVEFVKLWNGGHVGTAFLYLFMTNICALLLAFCGWALATIAE